MDRKELNQPQETTITVKFPDMIVGGLVVEEEEFKIDFTLCEDNILRK